MKRKHKMGALDPDSSNWTGKRKSDDAKLTNSECQVRRKKNRKNEKPYKNGNRTSRSKVKPIGSIAATHYGIDNDEDSVKRKNKAIALESVIAKDLIMDTEDDDITDHPQFDSIPQEVEAEAGGVERTENMNEMSTERNKLNREKDTACFDAEKTEEIRKMFAKRNKLIKKSPMIVKKEEGERASLSVDHENRYPIFFEDVKDFISLVQGTIKPDTCRWISVRKLSEVKNTILVSVKGPGLEEYTAEVDQCSSLPHYRIGVEIISPLCYSESLERGIASALSVTSNLGCDDEKCCPKEDEFTLSVQRCKDDCSETIDPPIVPTDNIYDDDLSTDEDSVDGDDYLSDSVTNYLDGTDNPKQTPPMSYYKRDKFSRLDLVMTPKEMAYEQYPLPFIPRYSRFIKTKSKYTPVTSKSPMFGLDCEMCMTQFGSELTRISVVNERHEVVYDKLVKPFNKIINYLTKYSGITPCMLRDVTTRLPDVQREIEEILPPDAILIGQSLNCDLIAMKMMHPYVIDTSVIYNISGERKTKTKLKTLAAEFLSEVIQGSDRIGHDSMEDALASLKLVQEKLRHSMEWGNAVLGYKRTKEESRAARNRLLLRRERKKSLVDQCKFRLAYNAVVDNPAMFRPPSFNKPLKNRCTDNPESECKKRKIESNVLKTTAAASGGSFKHRSSCVTPQFQKAKLKQVSSTPRWQYQEVVIIGSDKVIEFYKSHLRLSSDAVVRYNEANDIDSVFEEIISTDREEGNRIIVAHAHTQHPSVKQVDELSKKLMSQLEPNDLVSIGLYGDDKMASPSGALFVAVPVLNKLRPVAEFIFNNIETSTV